jgi:hypothetical protein
VTGAAGAFNAEIRMTRPDWAQDRKSDGCFKRKRLSLSHFKIRNRQNHIKIPEFPVLRANAVFALHGILYTVLIIHNQGFFRDKRDKRHSGRLT